MATHVVEAIDITRQFIEACDRICRGRGGFAKHVQATLDELLHDPTLRGLDRHQIVSTYLDHLYSSRVNGSVRLFDQEVTSTRLRAIYVGAHDPTYRWAEGYRGGKSQIVERRTRDIAAAPSKETLPSSESTLSAAEMTIPKRFRSAFSIPAAAAGATCCDAVPLTALEEIGLPKSVAKRVRQADVNTDWSNYGLAEFADQIQGLWVDWSDMKRTSRDEATVGSSLDIAGPVPQPSSSSITDSVSRDDESLQEPPTRVIADQSAPLPIPLASEGEVFTITSASQFAQMAEIGLERYLSVMTEEQCELTHLKQTGLLVVRGSGGSGKTTVAIHRVRFLADRISSQSVLIDRGPRKVLYLCYNQVLAHTVTQLLATLFGQRTPSHIEVSTLHGWAKTYLTSRGILSDVTRPESNPPFQKPRDDAEGYLSQLVRKRQERPMSRGGDTFWRRYPVQFYAREVLQVIIGRDLNTVEQYLVAERSGRGIGLSAAERHQIWTLFEEYLAELRSKHVTDIALLPALALKSLGEDRKFAPYEAVVIDEAQDLAPVQLRLAVRLAGHDLSRVTIFADVAQMVYPSGFSWKLAELNPRGGQVHTLHQNHRNTIEIHQAAQTLLSASQEGELRSELVMPEAPVIHGSKPILEVCATTDLQDSAIIRHIGWQLREGVTPNTIAVLAGANKYLNALAQAMRKNAIPCEVCKVRRRVSITHPSVKLLTLHSAKGLDFPHVYIADLTANGIPGGRTDLPQMADNEALEQQRRLLYTAMIRAGKTLVMTTVQGAQHPLLRDLSEDVCPRVIVSC